MSTGRVKNPQFVEQVSAVCTKDDQLVVVMYPLRPSCMILVLLTNTHPKFTMGIEIVPNHCALSSLDWIFC